MLLQEGEGGQLTPQRFKERPDFLMSANILLHRIMGPAIIVNAALGEVKNVTGLVKLPHAHPAYSLKTYVIN